MAHWSLIMFIRKSFVLLSSVITLFSCGSGSSHPDLYTVEVNTRDYMVEGSNKYQFGKEANLTIVPKNNAFLLPNDEDIIVYGANNVSYDKSTGKLNFIVNRDIRIDIITNSVYGREITLAEAGAWFNSHLIKEDIYTWSKQNYSWNLPGVNFPDNQITTFIKEEILSKSTFIKSTDITSSIGSKEITNTESKRFDRSDLDVGELGRDNNRYYLSNDHLSFGTDILSKATGATCGGIFQFFSFNEQVVMDQADFYFNDYLPYQTYEFHSTLNGELHWTTDSIKVEE